MRPDRLIRPGQRRSRASARPSHAGAEYPLKDFMVPPSDAKGRTVTISFSAPPSLRRLASVIVQKKVMPFETEGDIMRHATHQGLLGIAKKAEDREITSNLSTLQNWVSVAAEQMEHAYYHRHLTEIFDAVNKVGVNHPEKAMELADLVWRQSDRIDDPYWRTIFRDMAKGALDRLRRARKRKRAESEDAA